MRGSEIQTFEATIDGVLPEHGDTDEFGFPLEESRSSVATPPQKPSSLAPELSFISKKYDRNGKGYLDETEQAVRELDENGQGYLMPRDVFVLMESLQQEQYKSSALIEAIRSEHKKAMGLKRAVIGLTCFVVLLAVANIGTSFVAANLAKDTKVDNHNLVALDGEILGTSQQLTDINVRKLQELPHGDDRSRHLQDLEDFICENTPEGHVCTLQGELNFSDAVKLYQQFCNQWPNGDWLNGDSRCLGSGVPSLNLNCNGVRTELFGGIHIPAKGPTIDVFGFEYMIFPTEGGSFQGRTVVRNPSSLWGCLQNIEIGFYCATSGLPCIMFATFDPTCDTYEVDICG